MAREPWPSLVRRGLGVRRAQTSDEPSDRRAGMSLCGQPNGNRRPGQAQRRAAVPRLQLPRQARARAPWCPISSQVPSHATVPKFRHTQQTTRGFVPFLAHRPGRWRCELNRTLDSLRRCRRAGSSASCGARPRRMPTPLPVTSPITPATAVLCWSGAPASAAPRCVLVKAVSTTAMKASRRLCELGADLRLPPDRSGEFGSRDEAGGYGAGVGKTLAPGSRSWRCGPGWRWRCGCRRG